jgi:hypothetical protein
MDQVVEATDLETAHHLLSSAYGSIRLDGRGQRHGMRLAQASLGPIRFDHVTFRMDLDASVAPLGALYFGQSRPAPSATPRTAASGPSGPATSS